MPGERDGRARVRFLTRFVHSNDGAATAPQQRRYGTATAPRRRHTTGRETEQQAILIGEPEGTKTARARNPANAPAIHVRRDANRGARRDLERDLVAAAHAARRRGVVLRHRERRGGGRSGLGGRRRRALRRRARRARRARQLRRDGGVVVGVLGLSSVGSSFRKVRSCSRSSNALDLIGRQLAVRFSTGQATRSSFTMAARAGVQPRLFFPLIQEGRRS